ncbi:hypothetical protein [Helcococcus kunzii]|uniref:Uncharacterized protein n=1 Tax=Helcococcus kunzii ATCC 51366 TaxID=883114 RepID=H3NNI7_9FIRM|nr:hypothetical protein [Helcococcus kunzii]EHR33962.1 hypothetical protein HMPREF9709_00898 [Helcococcus kunzii ATCC 51366]QUY64813.1 hypothetical protein GUI37_04515 [Helcococcus kunzii]QZO77254.1 hypothetical protein HIF96_04350 [Helcococcus kunzii]
MRYIRDFFYNFSDIIFAIIVTALIGYVLFFNLNHLVNIENENVSTVQAKNEIVNKKDEEINVMIPSNLNVEQLAEILKEYKVINDTKPFIEKFKDTKKTIKSGEIKIKQDISLDELEKLIFE